MASINPWLITFEKRDCMVNGEPGLFLTWEHFMTGNYSAVRGIVEFADGVKRISPTDISFCDETHFQLVQYKKWLEEMAKNEEVKGE